MFSRCSISVANRSASILRSNCRDFCGPPGTSRQRARYLPLARLLTLATFLLLSSQCRVPGAVDGSFCDLVALLEPGDRGGLPRVQNLVLVLGCEPMRATDRLAGAGAVALGRGDAVGDALG